MGSKTLENQVVEPKKSSRDCFTVLYQLTHRPNGVEKTEVPLGFGATDAVFLASIRYPKDGGLQMVFESLDGRTGGPLDDLEWFKVWMLLAPRLANSPTLADGKRELCAHVHEIICDAFTRSTEKPKLAAVKEPT